MSTSVKSLSAYGAEDFEDKAKGFYILCFNNSLSIFKYPQTYVCGYAG
jgi:hypothetical protein